MNGCNLAESTSTGSPSTCHYCGQRESMCLINSDYWTLQLAPQNDDYRKELEVAQKRMKLLSVFGITNLVDVSAGA